MDWKIYFTDGTVADSESAQIGRVRTWGVTAIAQPEPRYLGREVLNRWECYFHDGSAWCGASWKTVLDRMLHGLPVIGYIEGCVPDRVTFDAIYQRAHDDLGMPEKVSYSEMESPHLGSEDPLRVIEAGSLPR